jgi:hypothetical protein
MAMIGPSSLAAAVTRPPRTSRPLAIAMLTAALALCFGLLVMAEMPGGQDIAVVPSLPVLGLNLSDTSVPAARFSADAPVSDEPPPSY